VKIIEACTDQSKAAMRAGTPPSCLLDYWTTRCLADEDDAKAAGIEPPAYTNSHAMAESACVCMHDWLTAMGYLSFGPIDIFVCFCDLSVCEKDWFGKPGL
jgi:hypothetical protein